MSTFNKQIDANIRDLDHSFFGSWSVDEDSAWNLGFPGAGTRNIGLRFTGVTIPQGSTINSAIIRFRDDDTKTVNLVARIRGIAEDNTAEFVLSPEDSARTRTKTTAVVNWSATINQSTGSNRDTPDITSIVQELVNRVGWVSGNAMAFYLDDNGSPSGHYLSVNEYDDNPSYSAILIVDYTEPDPGEPFSQRLSEISGVGIVPIGSRGIKLAKDGKTIESTNPDDYNLWTKYPPLTFLEKKTVQIEIDTTDGCPEVGTLTEIVPHDYDFFPFVIARVEQDGIEERYDMPVSDFPIFGAFCDGDHGLRFSFDYEIKDDSIEINYSAYCQGLVMGEENECISSTLTFNIYLYFYMWELGSAWPV